MSTLLVSYDIPDDRRRRNVAKVLAHFGRRVQYSVFLLHRGTPNDVASALQPLMLPAHDDIRIHPLCATCEAKAWLLGLSRETGFRGGYRIV